MAGKSRCSSPTRTVERCIIISLLTQNPGVLPAPGFSFIMFETPGGASYAGGHLFQYLRMM